MRAIYKTARLMGVSGVALSCAMLAMPALAQDAADSDGTGSEIIVTAQKRAQDVTDVPLTVSVMGDESLRASGATRIADVLPRIPAVGGFTTGAASSVWSIRGLSSSTTDGGGEPSVGVYRDESYAGYLEFAAMPVYDVARIEVLKGPQGTLYGKNSSAGAISVYTNKPNTDQISGMAIGGGGNFGQSRAEGRFNLPLSDTLAIRVAGQMNRFGDYQDNMVTGHKNGSSDSWGGRIGMLWKPSNAVELFGYYEHYDAHSDAWATNTTGLTRDTNTNHVYSVLDEGTDDLKVDFGHFEVTAKISDAVTLKSISNYSSSSYVWEADAFGTPIATTRAVTTSVFRVPMTSVLAIQAAPKGTDLPHTRLFQQELRLSWQASTLFLAGGVHYTDYKTTFPYTGAQLGADPVGIRRVDTAGFVGPRKSFGVFLDGTWDISERLSLTAGIRFSRDSRDWTSYATSDVYSLPTGVVTPSSFVDGTRDLTRLAGAGCPSNIIAPCLPAAGVSAHKTDSSWTPRIAFKWEMTPDINLYGGYSRGFKSGGFNSATNGSQVIAYEPETVDAFEFGMKGRSGPLRFGVAAFSSNFRNLQLQTIVNALIRTSNAAAARSRGVEAELNWEPSKNFTVFSNATYLDAKYTAGSLSQGITVPAKGLRLMRSPEFSFNIGATAGFDLGSAGRMELSPTFHSESSTELSPINRADFRQAAYQTLNMRLRYIAPSDKISLSLIGENLTNARLIRRVWDPLNLGASKNYNPDGALVRGELEIQF